MDRSHMRGNLVCCARRKFLKLSIAPAIASASPHIALAKSSSSSEKILEFINLHTDESLRCCYWTNGEYDSSSLLEINHILRDHRANEMHQIDVNLLEFLQLVHQTTGSRAPFHVISGYRSPLTNKKLRKQSNGVAKRSLHMQGKAIDIRLPDVKLEKLRDAAIALQIGGVGYYAKSNFVHLDIGRPRNW